MSQKNSQPNQMKTVKLVFYKKEVNKETTTLSYKTKGRGVLKCGVLILVGEIRHCRNDH